jgi:hypothetical protein
MDDFESLSDSKWECKPRSISFRRFVGRFWTRSKCGGSDQPTLLDRTTSPGSIRLARVEALEMGPRTLIRVSALKKRVHELTATPANPLLDGDN